MKILGWHAWATTVWTVFWPLGFDFLSC